MKSPLKKLVAKIGAGRLAAIFPPPTPYLFLGKKKVKIIFKENKIKKCSQSALITHLTASPETTSF